MEFFIKKISNSSDIKILLCAKTKKEGNESRLNKNKL